MADPPQMEEPTPISVAVLSGILNALFRITARISAVLMVPMMIGRDCLPVCRMTVRVETESQQDYRTLEHLLGNKGDTAFKTILFSFKKEG